MKKLSVIFAASLFFAGICATTLSIFPVNESKAQTMYTVHKIQKISTGQYFYFNEHPSKCGNIDYAYIYLGTVVQAFQGMTCFPPSGPK